MTFRASIATPSIVAVAGLVFALALPAMAQTTTDHLRGKVKSLAGDTLVIQPKAGKPVTVKLAAAWSVVLMQPVDPSAIQPGSFIGTTNMKRRDGTGRSLEVHVFPPGVKMGQGHYPWDLKPHSMMTNGDVGKVVAGSKGRMIEVAYPGGVRHILVPPNTPVVSTAPGDRAMVKPGVGVFIIPIKAADGTLGADRVVVGLNGAAPPM